MDFEEKFNVDCQLITYIDTYMHRQDGLRILKEIT